MIRTTTLAIAALALLAFLPGAEASCHFCLEDVQTHCVDSPDVGPCQDTVVYIAKHPVDFVEHLIGDDHDH